MSTWRGKDFGKGFYANPDYMQAVGFCSNVVRRERFRHSDSHVI